MSQRTSHSDRESELRLRALARLTGHADAVKPHANSAAALGILYEMASSPETSADAKALLHEIQVHQVEVELQDEELRRSRGELEVALARHVQLYNLAPFGYLTIKGGSEICEANLAGARLLGAKRDALLGRRLDRLLLPQSASVLHAMLADVQEGAPARTRTLQLASKGAEHAVHARASADAVLGSFLLALVGVDTGGGGDR